MIKAFSEIPQFLKAENPMGCFVDTTVLFAFSYPLDASNDASELALAPLADAKLPIFTNVNVRAEFLEQHRRALIAECLIDLYDDLGSIMEPRLALKLQSHKTLFRRKVGEEKSAKLDPNQIKMFRSLLKSFSPGKLNGWELFCDEYLKGRLASLWREIVSELNIEFLSLRQADDSPYLNAAPNWGDAVTLMERNGLASSDAMILNLFLSSKIPMLLTADLEMAEVAAKESRGLKSVFVPDTILSKE